MKRTFPRHCSGMDAGYPVTVRHDGLINADLAHGSYLIARLNGSEVEWERYGPDHAPIKYGTGTLADLYFELFLACEAVVR